MQLDFTQLHKGVQDELTKQANLEVVSSIPAGVKQVAGNVAPAAKSLIPAVAKAGAGAVARSLPLVGTVVNGLDAAHNLYQGDYLGAGISALGMIPGLGAPMLGVSLARNAVNGLGNMVKNQSGGVMGTVGKYAPLAMAGMAAMSPGRPQQQPMMGYPMQPPQTPSLFNANPMHTSSLGAPQMFKGASIVDALAGAAGRRVADQVLNKAVPAAPADPAQAAKEKEIELVTKYPEIEKMLEDKQNKAYLERLMSA